MRLFPLNHSENKTSQTREAAPGAVDVPEGLFLSNGPLDLLQDQVQLFGAPQVLLLGRVQTLPQRQELPLVDVNHISCRRTPDVLELLML